jgi:ADP-ribosylation factor GTPase-activating protein 1
MWSTCPVIFARYKPFNTRSSVTMDAWNEDQLKKMQAGGNGAMNDFFAKYGVQKDTDIRDKYNSPAAEFYRELIKARVEGRNYTAPDPSTVKKTTRSLHAQGRSSSNGRDAWGVNGSVSDSSSSRGEYRMEDLERSAAGKDDFFARKQMENSMKPEGIPPSQGGKYVGFGSQPAMPSRRHNHNQLEDVAGMVTKGFSELSVFAKTKAGEMNEALQEAGVAEKTKEYGAKGWSLLRTAYASAASTIEKTAAQQGYQLDLGSKKVADGIQTSVGGGRYSSLDTPPPDGHGFERQHTFEKQNSRQSSMHSSRVSAPPKQDNLLDVDDDTEDWGGWGQPTEPAPTRKSKQENDSTWDGWDDDPPPQKNGIKQSDESWGTW